MIVDSVTCMYIIKMFGRYTKKWDDVLGVFREKPLHDEWSNPADSLRYAVMGSREPSKPRAVRRRGRVAM